MRDRRRRGYSAAPPNLSTEAQAVVDAMAVPPSDTRQVFIGRMVDALDDAGLWAKMGGLWVLAAHSSQASLIDWIHPTDADMTMVATNSPAFTVDRGWAGDGSTKYLQTTETIDNMSPFALDSAHVGVWILDETAENNGDIASSAATNLRLSARTASGNILSRLNDTTNSNITIASSIGHSHANRSAAAVSRIYRNGADVGGNTATSVTVPTVALRLAQNTRRTSIGYMGSSLTAGEVATLYGIFQAYLASVGAV